VLANHPPRSRDVVLLSLQPTLSPDAPNGLISLSGMDGGRNHSLASNQARRCVTMVFMLFAFTAALLALAEQVQQ
jgi:hypothetical protein